MKVLPTNNHILRLALPISLALAIPQVSFMANTAFLGRYGERELAVNGVAGIFYLTLSMIGYGWSNGVQIQLARRAGEGDSEGLGKRLGNGVLLALSLSLVLIVLSLWLTPLIFGAALSDPQTADMSIDYLYIRVWGLPFLLLSQIANAFFIALHRSRFLIWGSLGGTLTNILLDYIFIFGHFGFPQMGLSGAAWASILGEAVFCSIMWISFYRNSFHKVYALRRYLRPDAMLTKKSFVIASPLIVQYLFSIGGWQIFFIFVEHLGTRPLAASQILRSILGVAGIGAWALAATCNTMVSNLLGQGKQRQVVYLIGKVVRISFLYAAALAILLLIFSRQFLSLYDNDPSIIAYAMPSFIVIVIATLIMSVSTVVFNGVVGTGNTLINLTIEVTAVCAYLTYCYVVIQHLRLPLVYAWCSEFVYWSSLLIISMGYLKSGRWKGKVL